MTTQEIEQAVIDNKKLVHFAIKKYFPSFYGDEDIFQVGWIGLWKACVGYNDSKSKFSTFAVRCIINEISAEVHSRSKQWQFGDIASLDEPLYLDKDGNAVTLAHTIPAPNDDYCVVDYDVSFLKGQLSERDIKVFKMNIYGFTAAEIARAFGYTRAWVSQIIKDAQALARKRMKS